MPIEQLANTVEIHSPPGLKISKLTPVEGIAPKVDQGVVRCGSMGFSSFLGPPERCSGQRFDDLAHLSAGHSHEGMELPLLEERPIVRSHQRPSNKFEVSVAELRPLLVVHPDSIALPAPDRRLRGVRN